MVSTKIQINLGTERKKLIHQKIFPTILELQQNIDTYQRNIKSKLSSISQMTEMNLDELEQKIRNSMQTATKQICSGKKPKCSKIKKETRDLMNIRRNTHRSDPNYRELNIKVKRGIRRYIRDHNNSMIECVH